MLSPLVSGSSRLWAQDSQIEAIFGLGRENAMSWRRDADVRLLALYGARRDRRGLESVLVDLDVQ